MQHTTRPAVPGVIIALLLAGCLPASHTGTTGRSDPSVIGADVLDVAQGEASYYADRFEGRPTASGEPFRQSELTAAHRTYPFGTVLRVVNLRNDAAVTVRVNDRGPSKASRIVDLSRRAAEALDMIRDGVVQVRVEVLRWGD